MEKLQECKAEVNNLAALDEIPVITGQELQQTFDKGGVELKNYLNDVLLPKVNDEMIKGIEENTSSITNIKNDITNIDSKVDSTVAKIYVNESTQDAVNTSPKIVFSKTVPTTKNYGANLPVGSIVFVY